MGAPSRLAPEAFLLTTATLPLAPCFTPEPWLLVDAEEMNRRHHTFTSVLAFGDDWHRSDAPAIHTFSGPVNSAGEWLHLP